MSAKIQKDYQEEVKQLVERVITVYQPEKIIAFGTTASGYVDEQSDIDLLVVKNTEKPFWERVKDVLPLYDGFRSFDVSVLTPYELGQAREKGWYFITEEILNKGKTLYERH
ncbi:nucleotidyltransferase domain-containing protein [Candidatus Woesebacteria bacterium]|nr:nucleotidyltransferase domain-containing protein [Candidatus Woesebacteria bacterium]